MKLRIPFYSSFAIPGYPEGVHCVETSLRMVLGYFEPDKSYPIEAVEKITGKQPGKGSWGMQWSLWFIEHGYEVKHYTTFDYEAFKNEGIEYIRREYGDEVADFQARTSDVEGAQQRVGEFIAKVMIIPQKPTIQDVRHEMADGYVAKVMVNSRVLNGLEGYEGHSVVVLDVDDSDIWFHDPGLPALEDRKMSHELFQQAMDSFGGEMDVIKLVEELTMESEMKNLKDGAQCKVVAGTHSGKAGTVRDINTSKTGQITVTVVQADGERFKTLAKNIVVEE